MNPGMTKDDGEDFAALLEEFDKKAPARDRRRRPSVGDLVQGRVISVGREAVFVTIGDGQAEGMLDLAELMDDKGDVTVKAGDVIEARVAEIGDKSDQLLLRRTIGRGPDARAELQQAFELGIPVEGTISGLNKGGLDVTVAGVRGFLPVSQLELRSVDADGAARLCRAQADLQGDPLRDRPARGEPGALATRALLEAAGPGARRPDPRPALGRCRGRRRGHRHQGLRRLRRPRRPGGHVARLGAGISAQPAPAEVLSVGQRLQVQVSDIKRTDDPKRPERISLSLKALERDPWEDATTRFPPAPGWSGG
jgi:small subunit ribosomal protein S1